MTEPDDNLFALGTQVQAGLDEQKYEVDTANFWKSKLTGFAHINVDDTMITSEENNKKTKVSSGAKKTGRVKKNKKKDNSINEKTFNKQRKFGSINKEIIRKHRELQVTAVNENEDLSGKDMQLLFDRNDWNNVHDALVDSLQKSNDDSNINSINRDKQHIVTEYADFRQVRNGTKNSNGSGTLTGVDSDTEISMASDHKKLTQFSCSYPSDFTTEDLGALYDITMSGVDLENNKNIARNEDISENVDSASNSIVVSTNHQLSGVFTLSQVLGENTPRKMETQQSDYDLIVIEDSESDNGSDSDDDITFEYIEKIKNRESKNGKPEDVNEETGTQQLPIEIDSSLGVEVEIPNSSDDEEEDSILIKNIVNPLSNKVALNDLEKEKTEVIEIENSSMDDESDSDIVLTGQPESGTQPMADFNDLEKEFELALNNATRVTCENKSKNNNSKEGSANLIVPTSSPISSDNEDESEINIINTGNMVVGVNLFANEENDVEKRDDGITDTQDNYEGLLTNEEFLTAPSQFIQTGPEKEHQQEKESEKENESVNIDNRMKYFEGWSVSMLKEQLDNWGIKNSSKVGKKSLQEKISNICKNISAKKWDWAINQFKKGEILDFTGWEKEGNGDEGIIVDVAIKEGEIIEQIRNALKKDQHIFYEILTYKPLNINDVTRRLNEQEEFKKLDIDRKRLCNTLDKLGICWTDVE